MENVDVAMGKRIVPETKCTEFPALYVDPRVRISRSYQRPTIDCCSYLLLEVVVFFITIFLLFSLFFYNSKLQ